MILALPDSAAALRDLDHLGLLRVIIPEVETMKVTSQPSPHRFTVWEHSLRTVASLDALLGDLSLLTPFSDDLAGHLREELGTGISRAQVLKLAGLLHDVAKPETRKEVDGRVRFIGHDLRGAESVGTIAERLCLPTKATKTLTQLVRHHLRTMHLGQLESISRRARYRFARDLGNDSQDLLLLALADAAAVTGADSASVWRGPSGQLIASLFQGRKEDESTRRVPPLIRGEDVMTYFGLTPGPMVGRLLEAAREAQALGLVSTKEEALAYLKRWRSDASEIP
jgi:putative nucleotidyltransferase with HDIG domain